MTGPVEEAGKVGMVDHAVAIVKGLTFANVAVIALLFMMAAPAWLAWRVINDDQLLTIIFSTYAELPLQLSECGARVASPRGGKPSWFISNTFALQGGDRWYVGVNTVVQPKDEEAEGYCKALSSIVAYMRDREAPAPLFPHSDKPILR